MTTAPRPAPKRPWTVTPHGPIEELEDNLWVVEGAVPTPGGIKRRMAIIRRTDGTLVFFHAMPLADDAMAQVAAWGTPKVLVLGHDQHAIDAEPFAQRLGLAIYGPGPNLSKLRARGLVIAGSLADLPADDSVRFEEMEGTKTGEAVGIVTSGGRVTLLFADCCQNNPGEGMWLPLRMLGFAGGPKVVPVFRFLFMSDRARLSAHLERLAGLPGLARVVPFHGRVVDDHPSAALQRVAVFS
jgi:hypothetical protein